MFYTGQKVVCVDDMPHIRADGTRDLALPIQEGTIYTIRWVGKQNFGRHGILDAVKLVGVYRPGYDGIFGLVSDYPFGARRFRPVVERKTDISIFTEILDRETINEPLVKRQLQHNV